MYLYMFGKVKVLFQNDFRLMVLDEGQKSQLSLGGLLWSPAGYQATKQKSRGRNLYLLTALPICPVNLLSNLHKFHH